MGWLAKLLAKMLSRRTLIPAGAGIAIGAAGHKALSGSGGSPISGALGVLPPVVAAGVTIWVGDRVLPARAFGGRKARDLALVGIGAGVGLLAYRNGLPETTA